MYGDEALQSDHFNSHLSFGDTQTIWARTGYLGFLRRTELTDASGGDYASLVLFIWFLAAGSLKKDANICCVARAA